MTNSSQGFNDDATGTEISDTSDDYDYDLDGNMTKDENKDITLIKYNHLNLPTEIQFTNNRTINYTYDATGMKKQKQVFDGTYTTITDYIDGYQYENKHINIGGRGYTHLLFFPHAEGYVKPVYSENKTLTTRLFSYVYNHTDHLGNIRVSYAKVDGVIEVLEENHYYPFGLKHQNYNATKSKLSLKASNNQKQVTTTVENPFKYKFNGTEYQDEFNLNMYDLGARGHDPARVQFAGIDPKAEDYYSQSPYVFAANNPVYYVDINGEGVENDYKLDKKTGKVTLIKVTDDKSDTLYATDKNGNVDKSKSVTVEKEKASDGTIISELETDKKDNSDKKVNFATTKKIKDALSVFQFAAYNSNVEWGLYGSTKDGGTFALGTYQDADKSPVFSGSNFNLGFTNRNVKFDIHSHVGRFAAEGPSGTTKPGDGDLGQKRTQIRFRYIYYNGYGRSTPRGTLFRYGLGNKTRNRGRFKPGVKSLTKEIKL